MTYLQTTILGIVEGLTEFLPISSTGHLILSSDLLGLTNTEFLKTFQISIQLGAILAIVYLYAPKFYKDVGLYLRLFLSFLPSAILGFLFYDFIKSVLFSPQIVAYSLIIGGIFLVWFEKIFRPKRKLVNIGQIPIKQTFLIGVFQTISMIPGVSRARATIVGGMLTGLSKRQATEFSFLLAVPTMMAATGYDLFQTSASFTTQEYFLLATGGITSFISAILAVKFFLKFLQHHSLATFGWYRIGIGLLFLITH